jgi:hypothetical protein
MVPGVIVFEAYKLIAAIYHEPFFTAKEAILNGWCGRWELNPHGPYGPADFLTGYGFRRSRLCAFALRRICGLDYPFTLLPDTGG